jgi:hypothetical protein
MVLLLKGEVGVGERGGYFYIRRWERVAGQEFALKSYPCQFSLTVRH